MKLKKEIKELSKTKKY